MPYTEVNGKSCFFSGDVQKEGRPLLFIHGSGGSHRHWLYQLEGLKNSPFNPLAPDLPGHGHSAGSPLDSIAGYREWVHDFARSLGLTRFVLAGHSMGGAIVLDYALHYPGSLEGIILIATGGRLRVAPIFLDTVRSGQPPAALIEFAYGPRAKPDLLKQAEEEINSVAPAVFLADFTACDRFESMEQLPQITLPALVVCGTEDRMTPLKYSHYLVRQMPRAKLAEIAAARHMVMLEAPDDLNKAVSDFMAALA